ncbi:MAG: hypothetical protein HOP28_08560, partial [Gemmatimonadales bacterium]|nr:hypothetical protein [Gemmatimonadales bacterium]
MTEDSGNLDSLPEPERWEVLARYLDGDSPAKEAEAVRRWIAADPSRMQVVAMLDRAVRQAEVRGPEVDVEGALRRVKARIDQPEVRELRSGARWPRLAFRAAAALAFLVGGSLLWQAVRSGKSIPSEPLIPRAYSTAPGAIDSVPLPGGGYAILGPRSRLTIDLGYGRQTRDVTLE